MTTTPTSVGPFGAPLRGPLHEAPRDVGMIEAGEMLDRTVQIVTEQGLALGHWDRAVLGRLHAELPPEEVAAVASMLGRAMRTSPLPAVR